MFVVDVCIFSSNKRDSSFFGQRNGLKRPSQVRNDISRSMKCLLVLSFVLGAAVAFPPFGFRRGPPPCGTPPFIDELPEDVQNKMREIWKDYKEGDKCYEQHGLTRELMETLPKETRRAVFKAGMMPPFLRKASKEVQEQFKTLLKDRSIPFEEKPAKFKELAEKTLTGDLLEEAKKFQEKMETRHEEFQKKVAALSPEAKELWDKMEVLMKQKWELVASAPENIRDEIMDLKRERPGPPHRRH